MKRRMLLLLVGGCLTVSAFADTAAVNTPGDGFLALRSEPSTKQGVRLGKIPHGTLLELGECVRPSATHRWCKTTYQGQIGWILDTYVIRDTARVREGQTAVDPSVERAILRAVAEDCTPDWCRASVEQVMGRYATVFMMCTLQACENATAYLKKEGNTWVLVDHGTGITHEDLIGYGFPSSVVDALMQ
ncbi:SH3 domain-containing protein [Thiocapsa rosea]|uniref:SH3 domain-containing protein n=1 Tax=Thiocapsa rosea TaxID=69360 RepID=A0A495ULP4_9GAMM|nr:SH3 domain-containing protein [Thiocapsa rosea]RKT37999.1 SH3 domain-containing protein [Thiocapsa rosea]